jgi:hypothetical protein
MDSEMMMQMGYLIRIIQLHRFSRDIWELTSVELAGVLLGSRVVADTVGSSVGVTDGICQKKVDMRVFISIH